MKLIVAENSGFCFGVAKAVELALHNAGEGTYTYGEIIHSERVIEQLRAAGVRPLSDLGREEDLKTVIIRSHGAGKAVFEELESRGVRVVDATCPFVKKIHRIVERYWQDGWHIVIIGQATHPEVMGINGWCGNEATVIDETDELAPLEGYEKLCFVTQTTFSTEKYAAILKKIAKHRLKTVELFDTICYTTVRRQSEAKELAQFCDRILVVGSTKSSNTGKLLSICKALQPESYLVETVSDLNKINFSAEDTVGIVGGASAPQELITEVKEYMSDKFAEVQNEEFIKGVEESLVSYKEGRTVKGTVISADEKGIKVMIGGKKDGFIRKEDVNVDGVYNPEDFVPDMEVEARIVKKSDDETGCILLSKKAVDEMREADKIVEFIRNGEPFEVKIDKSINGGLTARLGSYKVFIPASHVRERFVKDLKPFEGKKMEVVVLEIDDDKHKIVASHRKLVEAEQKEKEEVFWANVVPNMVVSGVVKRVTNFGAFVSVDGFDCLAHIVDLSWSHIKNVEEVLTIGETYNFLVLSADREKNRVSLGYKQLQPHPFTQCVEAHPIGSTTKGKVVSIVPFGVFVEIEPHIEGLVHVSEVAHNFVKNINEVIKVGDEVEVKILNYDEANKKINLSIKACLPEEERTEQQTEQGETKRPAKKTRGKSEKDAEAGEKEWSEDSANNPFADLLKDLDVQ